MLPGGVVMVAGYLMLYGAIAVGGGLVAWCLWRQWRAFQGRPRRPLPGWAVALAAILSIYPIFTGVTLLGILWSDRQHERQEMRWKPRRDVELREARQYGEITLPAGSVLNRIERQIPGTEDDPVDLDGVTALRLPQPQRIAGVQAIALHPMPATLELAEPHVFHPLEGPEKGQAVNCGAGWLVEFTVPPELEAGSDEWQHGMPAAWFQPSRWRFKRCFLSDPIRVVVLRDGVEMVVP